MKRLLINASLALSLLLNAHFSEAQTAGTLTFTFTTIAHTGYQNTKNVLAVWAQTNTGTFVKLFIVMLEIKQQIIYQLGP